MRPSFSLFHFCRRVACALPFFFVTNMAAAATFAGSGVGAIPDGVSATCPAPGSPLNITFNVSGMIASLTDIRVSMTFSPEHTFGGDVAATLIPPTGGGFTLFSRIGSSPTSNLGNSANLSGTYVFVDPSISTNNIWTAAATARDQGAPVLQGTYATIGAGPSSSSTTTPPLTQFLASFSSLTPAQLNGTWTLQVTDACEIDTGTISAASLTLEQGALPLQYSAAPYFIHYSTIPANTSSFAYPIVIYAPASNQQNIGFPANACVMSGNNPGDFMRVPDALSVAPGSTGQLLVQFRPSSNGYKSATMTCTAQPGGVAPSTVSIQLDGTGGDALPPPNCFDIDGDGVMNPLVDGLFITRLQLGLTPSTAAHGIAFQAPRQTTKRVMGFLSGRCGLTFPSTP